MPVRYISTRGQAEPLDFEQAMLTGLAPDGGLYVPDVWPRVEADELRAFQGRPYGELAKWIMRPFIGEAFDEAELRQIIDKAYAAFENDLVSPLVQIGANLWVMELFHGPTLAFKDVAMQVLGLMYDRVLDRAGRRATLIGATSGDTGSAAIEAVRRCEHVHIFIMHPHGRTSEVQRRQMTTVVEPNVHNIAIEGTFDDCQAILKAMFNDRAFRHEVAMSGVNSINWARVMPQVVYYFAAALALGAPAREVAFAVPTGNFGDIYAGYVARKMGLPVRRLIVASNVNDILTRAIRTGDHALAGVEPTMSPSMDIQVSSNFERLLFDAYDRDGEAIRGLMRRLADEKKFRIGPTQRRRIAEIFSAQRVDEDQTLDIVGELHRRTGYLVDPHTAVGVGAAWREMDALPGPMVALATAHPAKFPDAVEKALGRRPELPPHLADLYQRQERYDVLPVDVERIKTHVRSKLG